MRAVARAYGEDLGKHGDWHVALLAQMSTAGTNRPALLSPQTARALGAYLDFRHRFRNIYGVELNWTLMRPLVHGLEPSLAAFEPEIHQFLARGS